MSHDEHDDLSRIARDGQASDIEFAKRLALANVASALASGLLIPKEHSIDEAVAIYFNVLEKLQETGGGL